ILLTIVLRDVPPKPTLMMLAPGVAVVRTVFVMLTVSGRLSGLFGDERTWTASCPARFWSMLRLTIWPSAPPRLAPSVTANRPPTEFPLTWVLPTGGAAGLLPPEPWTQFAPSPTITIMFLAAALPFAVTFKALLPTWSLASPPVRLLLNVTFV